MTFQRLGDLLLGNKMVTLGHVVYILYMIYLSMYWGGSCKGFSYFYTKHWGNDSQFDKHFFHLGWFKGINTRSFTLKWPHVRFEPIIHSYMFGHVSPLFWTRFAVFFVEGHWDFEDFVVGFSHPDSNWIAPAKSWNLCWQLVGDFPIYLTKIGILNKSDVTTVVSWPLLNPYFPQFPYYGISDWANTMFPIEAWVSLSLGP